MKKILCILIGIMILCMGVTAYAEETAPDTAITTEAVSDNTTPGEAVTVNLGEWTWSMVGRYRVEIITAIGTILTTMAYIIWNKKVKPTVANLAEKTESFISGAEEDRKVSQKTNEAQIQEWREETAKMRKEQQEELKEYKDTCLEFYALVQSFADKVEENSRVNEVVLECLNDQEETLNTIVQSSTMAQWKKDIDGQRHAAHVAAISDKLKALKSIGNEATEGSEDGEC